MSWYTWAVLGKAGWTAIITPVFSAKKIQNKDVNFQEMKIQEKFPDLRMKVKNGLILQEKKEIEVM